MRPEAPVAEVGSFFRVLDELLAEDGSVSLSELLDKAGAQSFGLATVLLAIMCFLPGVANGVAVAITGLGLQMLWGMPHPWIPERLQRLEMRRGKVKESLAKLERYIRVLGVRNTPRRPLSPRLLGFLIAWTAFLTSLPIPLPMANVLPAMALALFGVALLEEWSFLAWLGTALSLATTVYFSLSLGLILRMFQGLWHMVQGHWHRLVV